MSQKEKIVIIGSVALGSKAACRFKRLNPKSDVTLIDKDNLISYGGCGIPFYISGDVSELQALRETSFFMLRDAQFFKDVKGVNRVLTETEALSINRKEKKVLVRKKDGKEETLSYDKLVIATGSSPNKLNIEGKDLKGIYTASNLHDAKNIKEAVAEGGAEKAVVIGAGFIGLEVAEALADMWGIETSVVEFCKQIMPGFVSETFADMATKHMEEQGVKVYLDEAVKSFEGKDGVVTKVITNKREIETDLVVMAVGITPATKIAKDAGLEVGKNGAIIVDEYMQTSDKDIFSGGDCVLSNNFITGKKSFAPLGSLANRQGRVIGSNLAGRKDKFKGVVGSFVVRIFETSLSGAGLTLQNALDAGFDAISVNMCQLDRAHFFPDKHLMFLELVVEKKTKRVLGIQGFGTKGDATVGRINTVAAILPYKPTLADISNLEFAYSPPFSSAMDIVNALANTAENFIDGLLEEVHYNDFYKKWQEREKKEVFFLDCRAFQDAKPFCEKYPEYWISIPQDELRKRIDEVPKDKKIMLICNTGVRAYEALLNLKEFGYSNAKSLSGGMATIKNLGIEI